MTADTIRRIAILTSGGDAPGMNAAIRALARASIAQGWEPHGVHNGFAGLLADQIEPLSARAVGGIIQCGGTMLGSARSKAFQTDAGRATALANLRRRGIDALFVIGGNGSQTGSQSLVQAGFPVLGVPSTIDNDLEGTDVTIGVDTAVSVTLEAMDRLRTTGASLQRAFLVETMGRHCGYIALMAGLAGGAEVIVIPEQEVQPHEVAVRLQAAWTRGKSHALVVVAEGANNGAEAILRHFVEHGDEIGFELRITRLGHVVRGGVPTATDRILATRLGVAAVGQLAQGIHGVLVGLRAGEIRTIPLADVAGRTKGPNVGLLETARMLAM